MVRAGCVFVAGIHPSRTWTSGSFESVRWNACVRRLDLGLYSHPKEFWGEWSLNPFSSKGKIPSTRKFPHRRIEPATLWTASPDRALLNPDDNQESLGHDRNCSVRFWFMWMSCRAYGIHANPFDTDRLLCLLPQDLYLLRQMCSWPC